MIFDGRGRGIGGPENRPYIPLQTKGVSEAADLFTTGLIQLQDKKDVKQIKSPQDNGLKQILIGRKKLDLQRLAYCQAHTIWTGIYLSLRSHPSRKCEVESPQGSRCSFAEQVLSPQFAQIK